MKKSRKKTRNDSKKRKRNTRVRNMITKQGKEKWKRTLDKNIKKK
jgi:hypothetical protein